MIDAGLEYESDDRLNGIDASENARQIINALQDPGSCDKKLQKKYRLSILGIEKALTWVMQEARS